MKYFETVRKLAAKAGFVQWDTEEYGPGPGYVDWSSEYDQELENFMLLVVKECVHLSDPQTRIRILDHFGLSK